MGPPTCGTGGVAGVTIGHMCMSATRAAGIPIDTPYCTAHQVLSLR